MLTPYEFALVQFTRFRLVRRRAGGVRFARLRRKAKHHLFATISLPQALLPPDSCVLRCQGSGTTYDFSGHRSTQRQGNKRQRTPRVFASRHRSRLNRVKRTVARRYNQSTSGFLSRMNPGGLKGVATPFARLSPLSFVVQRKMEPPEGVFPGTSRVNP